MPEKKPNAIISNINLNLTEDVEKDNNNKMCSDSFSSKYRVLAKIGEGSYSEVLKCRHRETGMIYACKRLKHSHQGWKRVNGISEVVTLRKLPRHPNILQMIEIHFDPGPGRVSLIFELMEMNLYELIKDRKRHVGPSRLLSEARVRVFMFQLVRALRHLHKNGIFHRDVKPENILVDTKAYILKLGDLGSVRGLYTKPPYTEYISTRWYRSPECLLTSGFYNYKMDVWAAGCVFFEIMTLRPLFPGASELDQISRIHQLLGLPPPKMLQKLADHSEMSRKINHRGAKPGRRDSITKILNQLQAAEKSSKGGGLTSSHNSRKYFVNIEKRLPNHINREAIDLLRNMLQYDPENRPTSHTALQHPYFDEMKNTAKTFSNKVAYQHPLLTILGPEYIKEVNDEEMQRKQLLKKELSEKFEDATTDEDDYNELVDKNRRRRRARRKAKVEFSRNGSGTFSETTLDSDDAPESKSPKEKVKMASENKELKNTKSYTEVKVENATKESTKAKPAKKAKYEESSTPVNVVVPKNRPPLPPSGKNLDSIQSSKTKISVARNTQRESFRSFSQIALIDEFPKPKNDTLTKSDMQKINEGRRLVQMLPIGKMDIKKSVLSSDMPPLLKASVSSSRDVPRQIKPNINFDSEPKINRIPNELSASESVNHKSPFVKTFVNKSKVGNVPSFADRLKNLYPVPKLLDTMHISQREPVTRKAILESKARALGILGYKTGNLYPSQALSGMKFDEQRSKLANKSGNLYPTQALSDIKYEEPRSKPTNSNVKAFPSGVNPIRKRLPVPAAPQMPPMSPVDVERHRSYLRRRRESINIDKYKNEISPYSKFFVDDLNDDEKNLRIKKSKDMTIIENVLDMKSGDKKSISSSVTNSVLGSYNAARKRVEAAAVEAAKMPLKFGALERHSLYVQRKPIDNNYKSDLTNYTKFFASSEIGDEGKSGHKKDAPLPRRDSILNIKVPEKKSINLDSNSNFTGFNRGMRKQTPFESVEMEHNRWFLPRNTGSIVTEKYKSELAPYSKYYTTEDHNKDLAKIKVKDNTGASSIVFPRNRFGDNPKISESAYKFRNTNNQSKDYKFPSKNSLDFHPSYRYPINTIPKAKL